MSVQGVKLSIGEQEVHLHREATLVLGLRRPCCLMGVSTALDGLSPIVRILHGVTSAQTSLVEERIGGEGEEYSRKATMGRESRDRGSILDVGGD